jgi:hypothetical protein
VHGLSAGFPAGFDDPVNAQIAVGRGWRADQHCLVRLASVQRLGIGFRIDRHRRYPHSPRRSDNPAGDLATIGD